MISKTTISWLLRIVVAVIFIQTLYFKFTAHPDSVHIFSSLGLEPFGRIGLGVAELITSILLLVPRTKIMGLILSIGIISGAIFSHFLVIGTNVEGDGGTLFCLALIILSACIGLLFIHKEEILGMIKKLQKSK
ncbi:DoxX family protein [uncultured Tenacibaculum sp.]|uniref:DoxX family protein n=1 Tax=uncultured Tenacibaculum sp. TaxID=174713 RepID=UPI00262098F9|nr:DoxX family protein [uncultured Tenacibaculum sp.]